jgi:hypothetical protein
MDRRATAAERDNEIDDDLIVVARATHHGNGAAVDQFITGLLSLAPEQEIRLSHSAQRCFGHARATPR